MNVSNKELFENITKFFLFEKDILETEGLSIESMEKYLSHSTQIIKNKGEYLNEIGENINGLYYVKKGRLRCDFLGKDGNTKTLSIIGEKCLFGEQFIFFSYPGLFETLVVEDSELYYFNRDTILSIMKKDFEITMIIATTVAIKARMLASQLEDMCVRNTLQNVSKILYSICCYEDKKKNDHKAKDIIIKLSHQDLAELTSSHRVTITKSLNHLKKLGILEYRYGNIIIKHKLKHKLKEIAYEIG